MPRGPSTFKQSDVVRALKAAAAAGLNVTGYKINPQSGAIEVVIAPAPGQDSPSQGENEWDRV
jgi:hypothetical protein